MLDFIKKTTEYEDISHISIGDANSNLFSPVKSSKMLLSHQLNDYGFTVLEKDSDVTRHAQHLGEQSSNIDQIVVPMELSQYCSS